MNVLTVTIPFADYQKGDRITDAETMKEIREGHLANHVVPHEVPDEDAPKDQE